MSESKFWSSCILYVRLGEWAQVVVGEGMSGFLKQIFIYLLVSILIYHACSFVLSTDFKIGEPQDSFHVISSFDAALVPSISFIQYSSPRNLVQFLLCSQLHSGWLFYLFIYTIFIPLTIIFKVFFFSFCLPSVLFLPPFLPLFSFSLFFCFPSVSFFLSLFVMAREGQCHSHLTILN